MKSTDWDLRHDGDGNVFFRWTVLEGMIDNVVSRPIEAWDGTTLRYAASTALAVDNPAMEAVFEIRSESDVLRMAGMLCGRDRVIFERLCLAIVRMMTYNR